MKPFFIWAGICAGLLVACVFFQQWPLNAYLGSAVLLATCGGIVFFCGRK